MYSVLHGNKQLFASKYRLYLPSEEELRVEIEIRKAIFEFSQREARKGEEKMRFDGIKFMNIDLLGLSQIYLNQDKITSIMGWFHPPYMDNFKPLSVHDFGNNAYTITDGHTRAYVAYKSGISYLPVQYDNDDLVAGEVGQMLYKADLEWCQRFRLTHIKQLENRILDNSSYQKLWIGRCDRSYDLLMNTSHSERISLQKVAPDLFLYGAEEDLLTLYFENEAGELFVSKDNIILPEEAVF